MSNHNYPNAGWYLRNCQQAFAITRDGGSFRFGRWPGRKITGLVQWRREFLAALDRRINAKGVLDKSRGRKDNPDWQRWVSLVAAEVNSPRLIVRPHGVPLELRGRLAHRLTHPDDE